MLKRQFCSALFLISSFAGLAGAQENACTKKLADVSPIPEFRDFRMGMTQAQVKARVPQVVFEPVNDLGLSKVSINPFFDAKIDKTSFEDVRTVSLDFLDGKLALLWIGFENTFKWKTVDEFVKGVSPELGVSDQWNTKGRSQQLRCADFELSVSMIAGGPSLRIVDSTAAETLAARRQAKEDAAAAAEAAAAELHPVIGDTRKKIYYPSDCEALKTVP